MEMIKNKYNKYLLVFHSLPIDLSTLLLANSFLINFSEEEILISANKSYRMIEKVSETSYSCPNGYLFNNVDLTCFKIYKGLSFNE
jgi:hypothetical protein